MGRTSYNSLVDAQGNLRVQPLDEKETFVYETTLVDEDGVAIPGASLTTCTMTLYNENDNAIINSRLAVDVSSLVDGAGLLSFVSAIADGTIIDSTQAYERHIMLFEYTWLAGARRGSHEVELIVRNLSKVT